MVSCSGTGLPDGHAQPSHSYWMTSINGHFYSALVGGSKVAPVVTVQLQALQMQCTKKTDTKTDREKWMKNT